MRETLGTFRYNSIGSFVKGGAYRTYGWVDPAKDLVGIIFMQRTNGGGDVGGRDQQLHMAMAAAAGLSNDAQQRYQLPGFIEQAGVHGRGIVGAVLDPEDREVPIARRGEISGPVGPIGGQPAVDHHVVVRAERVGIDQRRHRLSRRETLAAQRHRIFGPVQRRQFAVEFGDPAIAPRISEQHHVVLGEIVRRHILVVLHADVAAICQRVLPVEPLQNPQCLIVRRRVPRGPRRPDH